MDRTLTHFPANPEYGRGVYRRRLRFVAGADGITAQVDDTHHSYWMILDHDGALVTHIDAGFVRHPNTACPGATGGLKALVGEPIHMSASEAMARLPASSNCTHLADLAWWSLAHRTRSVEWEIAVPDQVDFPVWVEAKLNGNNLHRWKVADGHIVAPGALAGLPLMKGFMAWARDMFDEEALLAATMLQRGLFVARGRAYVVDQGLPVPLVHAQGMAGNCWSYSGARLTNATGSLDYVRDFTDGIVPETPPPHVVARLEGHGS